MARARIDREIESLNGWWHTWLDEQADWQGEPPIDPGAPPEVLPQRAPSAGWHGMEWGMESTRVPGTLAQAREDYHGVAWQWRPIVIPEAWQGRVVRLLFAGARQRTEVFLDDHPVGYDLDGLSPFVIDLTPHVRSGGQYEMAIRVTNPGGWRGGEASAPVRWGGAALPGSRDVGGLWGGVALAALPSLHLADLFVEPGEALGEALAHVALRNDGVATVAEVCVTVLGADGRRAGEATAAKAVAMAAGEGIAVDLPLRILQPQAWSPGQPALYRVVAEVRSDHGLDRAEVPLGLGRAVLGDGRRDPDDVSWAMDAMAVNRHDVFFSPHPTPAEAESVVARARATRRAGLVAEDWPVAPALLDAADRLGMLVVQGLVGVDDPAGVSAGARGLFRALARDRLRRLIRRDRNHPAVVAWRLPVAREEAVFDEYVRLAREEDPTRPVLPAPARAIRR